ncbi:hypothetical protein [Oceanobacillus senegalensis]|nr:hypothetical protein [Oceanobacillus senegalensis]
MVVHSTTIQILASASLRPTHGVIKQTEWPSISHPVSISFI